MLTSDNNFFWCTKNTYINKEKKMMEKNALLLQPSVFFDGTRPIVWGRRHCSPAKLSSPLPSWQNYEVSKNILSRMSCKKWKNWISNLQILFLDHKNRIQNFLLELSIIISLKFQVITCGNWRIFPSVNIEVWTRG